MRARAHLSGGELAQAHAAGGGLRVMFDASALVQRYAAEVGHARVLALMEQTEQVLLAAHCLSEVGAGLLRLRRDACLAPAEFDRAWQAVQRVTWPISLPHPGRSPCRTICLCGDGARQEPLR